VKDRSLHPSFTLTDADAVYFDRIPAKFLVVLKLMHHEKMNHEEIAAQERISIGTVSSRIFRARQIIKRLRAEDEARAEVWQRPTLPLAREMGR